MGGIESPLLPGFDSAPGYIFKSRTRRELGAESSFLTEVFLGGGSDVCTISRE